MEEKSNAEFMCVVFHNIFVLSQSTSHVVVDDHYHRHHHVDWVRLRLWTATINGQVIGMWVYRTVVEWYRQGKTPDSSTRALWQSYRQSSNSKAGGTDKIIYELCLTKYLFHVSERSLTCRKILRHGADCFTYLLMEGVLRLFISLNKFFVLGRIWTREP
jgi:hypothetical protein